MYCTAQKTPSHTHTLPGTRLHPSGHIVGLHPAHQVAGFCPDVVIISLMLAQMSMGSGDKGFLIPHMNLAPRGREEAECVANIRELHEGEYITPD